MVNPHEIALSETPPLPLIMTAEPTHGREPAPAADLAELRARFQVLAEGYREGIYETIVSIFRICRAAEGNADLRHQLLQQCAAGSQRKPNPAKLALEITKFVLGQSSTREKQRASKLAGIIDYLRHLQLTPSECLAHLHSPGVEQLAQLARKARSNPADREPTSRATRVLAIFSPHLAAQLAELIDKRCYLVGSVKSTRPGKYVLEIVDFFGDADVFTPETDTDHAVDDAMKQPKSSSGGPI